MQVALIPKKVTRVSSWDQGGAEEFCAVGTKRNVPESDPSLCALDDCDALVRMGMDDSATVISF